MSVLASKLARQALGLPISILMLIFFAVPMFLTLSLAIRPYSATELIGTSFTLSNFGRFLGDPTHLATFARTFVISLATTVLCMLLAYPLAWHLHRLRSATARLWLTLLVLMPLMVSLVVASFAWVLILGNNGALNVTLLRLGLISEPIQLMNTATGVVVVAVFSHISYSILTTFAALENIDASFARAARIHGASETQVFVRVILPLSLPGMIAGGLIVFSLNMAAFVIPFLIGGGRVTVVPLLIYQYTMQLFDWPGAAAMGTLLFASTLLVTYVVTALAQRAIPWERRR